MSDALYTIRDKLGHNVIQSFGPTLVLNDNVIQTDLAVFRHAVLTHQHAVAVAEYGGAFLEGFHLGVGTFEEWVDAVRQQLALDCGASLTALADDAERAGDFVQAAMWWRRLLRQDPFNSRVAMSLARILLHAGDRGNALLVLEEHRRLLREELDAQTGTELRGLLHQAREEGDIP